MLVHHQFYLSFFKRIYFCHWCGTTCANFNYQDPDFTLATKHLVHFFSYIATHRQSAIVLVWNQLQTVMIHRRAWSIFVGWTILGCNMDLVKLEIVSKYYITWDCFQSYYKSKCKKSCCLKNLPYTMLLGFSLEPGDDRRRCFHVPRVPSFGVGGC